MCNCMSPKVSFVVMLPLFGTHTTASPSIFHFASPLPLFHAERSLPSNKTIASAGGCDRFVRRQGSFCMEERQWRSEMENRRRRRRVRAEERQHHNEGNFR